MRSKKNWYSFRRLNIITLSFIISAFALLSVSCVDREERLYGRWNLQTVLMNDEPLNDSMQFNVIPKWTNYKFFYMNSLDVSTVALGQPVSSPDGYYYFSNKSTLEMQYTLLYKRYDISAKIKKLTTNELNLEYTDNGNTYFLQLFSY